MDDIKNRILRQPEVLHVSGFSEASLVRAIKLGTFPSPVKLTAGRAKGWRASDIQRWLDSLQPVDASQPINLEPASGCQLTQPEDQSQSSPLAESKGQP